MCESVCIYFKSSLLDYDNVVDDDEEERDDVGHTDEHEGVGLRKGVRLHAAALPLRLVV